MFKNKNVSRMLATLTSLAMLLGMTVIFPAATVSAEAAGETITDTLVNGDMEWGSWYTWAGDNVLYNNGTVSLTGNSLNAKVSTDWIVHNAHAMVFADWDPDGAQQVSQTDPSVSEMVPGCRTTIKEEMFSTMDPANMEFSIYARSVGTDQSDYLAFGVKYRVVNNDGTTGEYHTASLLESFVANEDWVRVSAVLDDLTAECANARTIEFELFNRIVKDDGWGGMFLDDADVTSVKITPEVVNTTSLVNGDMEQGSWYAWAGDTVLASYVPYDQGGYIYSEYSTQAGTPITGTELDAHVTTGSTKHSGNQAMQFARDSISYPSIGNGEGRWNESQTIPGCKTTVKEDNFARMDLSQMTFSIWTYVMTDNVAGQFFAFDVKYRAVNNDGTYGPQHVTSLTSCITAGYTWINAVAPLDNMTEECENAETIEIEIFTKTYCTVVLDDADITAPLKPIEAVASTLVNGNMEQGSWYAWAGDAEVAGSGLTGNQLNSEISTTGRKHSGQKSMQFVRDQDYYPARAWDPDNGLWGESEMIAGCKTTIDENEFAKMDLAWLTFSMWIFADSDQLFALDVKYRAVNKDGTTGDDHTLSLRDQVTEYGTWVEVSAPLDDMTAECANARTIEFELFTRSYCTLYLDDANVTAPGIPTLYGDFNGNNKTDSEDLILLRKYLLLGYSEYPDNVFDVKHDGQVNVADLVRLKKILVDTLENISENVQQYGENLVVNGDAELGIWGEDPTAQRYREDCTIVRDTQVKCSGNASAKLQCTNVNGNASIHCQILPFDRTKRYRIEMDVKTEFSDDNAITYFGLLESGGNKWTTVMGEESHNRITATQDWTHFSINVSNFDSRTFGVVMYIHMSGVGTAWYDNITVREILPPDGVEGEVTADVQSGRVNPGQEVWLTTGSRNADIYYTVDGSDPSTSSTRYYYSGKAVIISENTTLKAVAVDAQGPRKTAIYDYTVNGAYIANGGFEDGVWKNADSLNCAADSQQSHSGSKSLKLLPSAGGTLKGEWIPLNSAYDYELTFWAKTAGLSGNGAAYLTMLVKDMNGGDAGYYEQRQRLVPLPANSDWTEYKVYLNDLCYSKAQICIAMDSDSGTAWFDDVKLTAKQDDTYPVMISPVNSEETFAGIYYNSLDDPSFDINMGASVTNLANCDQNVTVTYRVINLQDNTEESFVFNDLVIPGKANNATLLNALDLSSIVKYGIYKVVFSVTDEAGCVYEAGSFDITRSDMENNASLDWLGLGTHELTSEAEARLEQFQKAGIGAIRWGAMWESVEQTKGVYTFDPAGDEIIRLMQSKGMHVILLLGECNRLYNNGERPKSDADNQAFAAYCKATVAHYKQLGIKEYEMWNEYDFEAWLQGEPDLGVAAYAATIKAAYPAMKEADPDCVVINGCTTTGGTISFITGMMNQGLYDYTDAVSIHPYCYQAEYGTSEAGGFIEMCRDVYNRVNSYGTTKDIKIWITEFGFQTAQNFYGQTEAESARNIIRTLALASANLDFIEKAYIYEEYDRLGINVRDGEHHFGVTHGPASAIPYSAKPALPALSAFASKLYNATYVTTHHYGPLQHYYGPNNGYYYDAVYGAVVAHEYSYRDGRTLFALYDVDNVGRRLSVHLQSSDVALYDMYGNPIDVDIDASGNMVLDLDGDMVYMVLGESNALISAELS